jgi:[ribosomal protein S18]-alanine N-acetyltransferase
MDSGPHLRFSPMTTAHLPAVVAIEKSVFPDPWSTGAFVELMSLSDRVWVALSDERVVGYLVTQWILDEVHILNVAVSSDMQRRGVGAAMLRYLVDLATDKGMREMFLEVRVGNTAARTLYTRFGFSALAVRKKYYSDNEDALVMHCRLTPAEAADSGTTSDSTDTTR